MGRLKQNVVCNLLQTLIPMIVWIVLVPLIVNQLGPAQFGVWALIQALIGQMGMLDLGIGPTVIRLVSDASSRLDYDKARRVSGDAIIVYSFLGLSAGLGVWLSLPVFMQQLFRMPEDGRPLLPTIAGLIGIQIAFSLPGSVFTSISRGIQRYDIYALQRVGQTLLMSVLILVSFHLHLGLLGVIAAGTLSTFIMYIWSATWIWRMEPQFIPKPKGWSMLSIKQLTTQSIWLFVLQVSGMLVFSVSKLVIGALVSLEAVAVYEIALRVFDFLRVIVTALTDALMPTASRLSALGESGRIRQLFLAGVSLMWLLSLVIVVPLFVVAPWIMQIWVGTGLGVSAALVLRIMLVGFCAYSLTRVPMSILIGTGQVKTYVIVRAISAVLIPFAIWIGAHAPQSPLLGAAIANSGGMLIFDGFLFIYAVLLFRGRFRELAIENLGGTISFLGAGAIVLLAQPKILSGWDPESTTGMLLIAWALLSVLLLFVGDSLKLWKLPRAIELVHVILNKRRDFQAL